ncbi:MAG: hypothetical protein JXR95_01370 [Deltaproteobacteria bacterium]|nr:hypothetical protein [Deltaproteobacteria bacterium]
MEAQIVCEKKQKQKQLLFVLVVLFHVFTASCNHNHKTTSRPETQEYRPEILNVNNPSCHLVDEEVLKLLYTPMHKWVDKLNKKKCKGEKITQFLLRGIRSELDTANSDATGSYILYLLKAPSDTLYYESKLFAISRIRKLDVLTKKTLKSLGIFFKNNPDFHPGKELETRLKITRNFFPGSDIIRGNEVSEKKCYSSVRDFFSRSGGFTDERCSVSYQLSDSSLNLHCEKDEIINPVVYSRSPSVLFINNTRILDAGNYSLSLYGKIPLRIKLSKGDHTILLSSIRNNGNTSYFKVFTGKSCKIIGKVSKLSSFEILELPGKSNSFFYNASLCGYSQYTICRFMLQKSVDKYEIAAKIYAEAILKDPTVPPRFRPNLANESTDKYSGKWKSYIHGKFDIKNCFECDLKKAQKLIWDLKHKDAEKLLKKHIYSHSEDARLFKALVKLELYRHDKVAALRWMKQIKALTGTADDLVENLYSLNLQKEAFDELKNRMEYGLQTWEEVVTGALILRKKSKDQNEAVKLLLENYNRFSGIEEFVLKLTDFMMEIRDIKDVHQFLEKHLSKSPFHTSLLKILHRTGSNFPFNLTDDHHKLLKNFPPEISESQSATFILDETKTRVFESGAGYHYIRKLIYLPTNSSIEEFGEISVPENAVVVSLQTIKPDGSRIRPLLTPEKASWSMRNLESGDIVRVEYILPFSGIKGAKGVFWGPRFYFTQRFYPVLLSTHTVISPKTMKILLDSTGKLPEPEVTYPSPSLKKTTFKMHYNSPTPGERRMSSYSGSFPSIRITGNLDQKIFSAIVQSDVPHELTGSPEIKTLVKKLCIQKQGCLGNIRKWITENIASSSSTKVVDIFWNRKGSRAHMFTSMAHYAGFHVKTVYAVPMRHIVPFTNFPELKTFVIPLNITPDGKFQDLRYSLLSPGSIPPALQNSIFIDPETGETGKFGQVKSSKLEIKGTINCEGDKCILKLSEKLTGFSAARKFKLFGHFDNNKIRRYIESTTLSKAYPGAVLRNFRFSKNEDNSVLINWELELILYKRGSELHLKNYFQLSRLARGYHVHQKRTLPMLTRYSPVRIMELKIFPPDGYRVDSEVERSITADYGFIKRKLTANNGGSAHLKINSVINYTEVSPARWKRFRKFSMDFDETEQQDIVFIKK